MVRWPDIGDLLGAFEATRARSLEMASDPPAGMHQHFFDHPIIGPMNCATNGFVSGYALRTARKANGRSDGPPSFSTQLRSRPSKFATMLTRAKRWRQWPVSPRCSASAKM